MATVADLEACGPRHLQSYCDPSSLYAWPSYDEDPNAGRLVPLDLLAPALLKARIDGLRVLKILHEPDGPYHVLGVALGEAISDDNARTARFEDVDLVDPEQPWRLVLAAFEACRSTLHIKATKVSKVLHRKLPNLVPVYDRLVRRYYDAPADVSAFWAIVQKDLRDNVDLLDELRAGYETPTGRPLGRLRALDIIIWTHMSTGCDQ